MLVVRHASIYDYHSRLGLASCPYISLLNPQTPKPPTAKKRDLTFMGFVSGAWSLPGRLQVIKMAVVISSCTASIKNYHTCIPGLAGSLRMYRVQGLWLLIPGFGCTSRNPKPAVFVSAFGSSCLEPKA